MDGKTLRGSRTRDHAARHVLVAADRRTGLILPSTDVDSGHGRREIRALKVLSISIGIDFPTPPTQSRSAAGAASPNRAASPPGSRRT